MIEKINKIRNLVLERKGTAKETMNMVFFSFLAVKCMCNLNFEEFGRS
jgi:hypothetical protein